MNQLVTMSKRLQLCLFLPFLWLSALGQAVFDDPDHAIFDPVNSVTYIYIDSENEDASTSSGFRELSKDRYHYDRKGKLTRLEKILIEPDHSTITSYTDYSYDKRGNLLQITDANFDGATGDTIWNFVRNTYAKGGLLKTAVNSRKIGSGEEEVVSTETWNYDKLGLPYEKKLLDPVGTLLSRVAYRYDEFGFCNQEITYGGSGEMLKTREYSYEGEQKREEALSYSAGERRLQTKEVTIHESGFMVSREIFRCEGVESGCIKKLGWQYAGGKTPLYQSTYESDQSISSEYTYSYQADERENWIRQYLEKSEHDHPEAAVLICERTIEYR